MSVTLKPSASMLAVICGTDSGMPPSMSTCPKSEVISTAAMFFMPT